MNTYKNRIVTTLFMAFMIVMLLPIVSSAATGKERQEYADRVIDKFIEENITNGMTVKEKVEAATKFVAETTSYSPDYASYVSLFYYGAGDCWASAGAIEEICCRMGLDAYTRNANKDKYGLSGHRNAIIKDGDKYYIAEAGYNEPKPRRWNITEKNTPFSTDEKYRGTDGIILAQCDIVEDTDKNLTIPSTLNGSKVIGIGEIFASRSYKSYIWESITIEEGIKRIDNSAFCFWAYSTKSRLKSIRIPSTVTEIGKSILLECPNLTEIYVSPKNNSFKAENCVLYSKDGKRLVAAPTANISTLPEGVEIVDEWAFYHNDKISKIVFPESLTNINDSAFADSKATKMLFRGHMPIIEDGAFRNLDLIIYYPENDKTWSTDNKYGAHSIKWVPYNPEAVDIADCSIKRNIKYFQHDGSPQMPEYTIKYNGIILVRNRDYKVSYKDNTEIGQATAVITGIGDYTGEITKTFPITPTFDIEMDAGTNTLSLESKQLLFATAKSESERFVHTFKVSISDSDILKVDTNSSNAYCHMYLTGLKEGETTVTVTDNYGFSKSYTVNVTALPQNAHEYSFVIYEEYEGEKIKVGSSKSYEVYDDSVHDYQGKYTVKSSDTSIAAISILENGNGYCEFKVKGKEEGCATITISNDYGLTMTRKVKIVTRKTEDADHVTTVPNSLSAKGRTVKIKYSKVKSKTLTISRKKAISVKYAQGKVTYKKISGNKKIKINKKTGKITVKKGLKKGTYKVKVKVRAAGLPHYEPKGVKNTIFKVKPEATKVTCKIIVK